MADIFKCKDEMPSSTERSDLVVRAAMTLPEASYNQTPATFPDPSHGVKSVQRPRYGHGY